MILDKIKRFLAAVSNQSVNILISVLAGVAGVAGSYAVAGFTPNFVAGPIAGFMARNMPGSAISFAIVVLGDLGHKLNLFGAITTAIMGLSAISLVGLIQEEQKETFLLGPVISTIGGTLFAFIVTQALLPSLITGFSAGIVIAAGKLLTFEKVTDLSETRRRILGSTGGALIIGVGGYILGNEGGIHGATVNADMNIGDTDSVDMPTSELLAEAEEKSLDVEGLEPLVSDEFYEVDINSTDPVVKADNWELEITGAVDEEVSYTYEDITDMTPENRFVTLRCVGENLNGKKLDNAVWTGVPIMDLLEPAGVNEDDGCCVMLRAEDGFFEEFPVSALSDGFLAYGMNGSTLPRGHGYPARALIPGHWGEINVKWINEIEILEKEEDGYWEKRGWHGTGPVNTVAKLYVDNHLDDGRIEVAGHAYAGIRGIEKVEVSTDGGDSWNEATLSEPLTGDDVWRQWVYRYESPGNKHEVVVRATDGEGNLQPQERKKAFPRGATGWVSKEIKP